MASFHLRIKSGKKGNAVDHADYIAREGKHGRNGGQDDLIATVHGNMPEWTKGNPSKFWRAADRNERSGGTSYREYVLALPNELSSKQQREIVDDFVKSVICDKPYQVAIHAPIAALGGVEQPHAHVMFSDRLPDGIERSPELHFKRYNAANPERGGCKKDSGGKNIDVLRDELTNTRKTWADIQNFALEKHGHNGRVDHRSNRDRGIERAPERHLGQSGIKKMSAANKAEYVENRQNGQLAMA